MPDPESLVLSIHIAARPATVFRFLSDPARFRQWMGDGAELGAGPGAPIRIAYGNGGIAEGSILEVVPDRHLVFGYGYRGDAALPPGASTVRIELSAEGGGTRVRLEHAGLPGAEARQGHAMGWTHYLSRLRVMATAEGFGPLVEPAVDAFIAAWGETDPVRRSQLIASCWDPDALFADAMGTAEGRAGLDGYIAGAQSYMPGVRLERDGAAELVLDRVRFRWRARAPGDVIVARGLDVGELSPAGRFTRMTGWWDAQSPGASSAPPASSA